MTVTRRRRRAQKRGRIRGLARLRGFEGWGEAKLLIHREVTPKGRHYTGVTEATWAAVIFGGGCGGSANFSRSNSSFSSGSGCV